MSEMRAKLRIRSIKNYPETGDATQQTLTFAAVGPKEPYPADGSDENNTFARFTPSADLTMCITNPALIGKFEEGQEYYVDFSKAA